MFRRTFLLSSAAACIAPLRAANSSLGTVAYVHQGDLWVRSLLDGTPKRLTNGRGIESPRFSPSGQWIACKNKDAIYVLSTGGGSERQLQPGEFSWMPGRDVLVVAGGNRVGLIDAQNWVASTIVSGDADLPVFSPDGTQFAYATAVTTGRGHGGEPLRIGQIRIASLTHPEPRTLVSKYLTGFGPCLWTRDGKSLLYWEDPDFSASVAADGLELFRINASGGPPESLRLTTLVHEDMISLSPVTNSLAVAAGGGRETWSGKRIAIVDLDRSAVRYATHDDTAALTPSWSPDGKQIALSAASDVQKRRIWTIDISASANPSRLTNDDHYRDEHPLWSADGTHILFCRMDRAGKGMLWLMSATGEYPNPVSAELTLKTGIMGTAGFYGYLDWRRSFDWFRGPI